LADVQVKWSLKILKTNHHYEKNFNTQFIITNIQNKFLKSLVPW